MNIDEIPKTGWKGFTNHWREDLFAAMSVALVAMPLALGIAIASGAPPISGLISAILAGFVTTLFRGSYISIHGPAAGLVVVVLGAYQSLDDGTGNTMRYLTAVFVVVGIIQVILGLLRFGKYGDFFPSAVIQGMLAAIGLIIIIKQFHEALGVPQSTSNAFDTLLLIPNSIMGLNPFVTLIGLISLTILIVFPKINNKLISAIPGPVWVLVISIPFVYLFDFFQPHSLNFFGTFFEVGPNYLISVPTNIMDGIFFPDFSMIGTGNFWLAVISICLVASLETLIISKACDKLDPYKRNTWLNRELISVGLCTSAAGLIGGLPIIPVIIRSSVNVNHGAKTRFSNLYHAIILLSMVLIFPKLMQMIPLAALAAILVFTGYKLASPRVFIEAMRKGTEQLVILIVTLIVCLLSNLLWGIFVGILATIVIHYFKLGIPISKFVTYLVKPFSKVIHEDRNNYLLKIKGISNFFNLIHIIGHLNKMPPRKRLIIDLSHARLIDFTVLEYLDEFAEKYERGGGMFDIVGLDIHESNSTHPFALRVIKQENKIIKLTRRQLKIKQLAAENNLPYIPEISYDVGTLKNFLFFNTRPIQFKKNTIKGYDGELKVRWEISDITFDVGALLAAETHHTTIQVIELPFEIPVFSLEKEVFYDKLLELAGMDDIDFDDHKEFSKRFNLKGPQEKAIREFFTKDLINFFEKMDIYHLESSGHALLVFKYIRIASPSEVIKMYHFSRQLVKRLSLKYAPGDERIPSKIKMKDNPS